MTDAKDFPIVFTRADDSKSTVMASDIVNAILMMPELEGMARDALAARDKNRELTQEEVARLERFAKPEHHVRSDSPITKVKESLKTPVDGA